MPKGSGSRRPWTEEEDRIVTEMTLDGYSRKTIGDHIDRTEHAIQMKRKQLGITQDNRNIWKPHEKERNCYRLVCYKADIVASIGRHLYSQDGFCLTRKRQTFADLIRWRTGHAI